MIVVESMEPTLGSLKEWLLTPAPAVAGLETPYLLAREVPPPLAFVLHLCNTWSPEVLLTLVCIGTVACGAIASRIGLSIVRYALSLLVWLCGRIGRLESRSTKRAAREAARNAVPQVVRAPPVSEPVRAPSAPVTAVLTADREARLRTLHVSDSEVTGLPSLHSARPHSASSCSASEASVPVREPRRKRQPRGGY